MSNEKVKEIINDYFVGHTMDEINEAIHIINNLLLLDQKPIEGMVAINTIKEEMCKYGFIAPDMTVTEFVETLQALRPVYVNEKICKTCDDVSKETMISYLRNALYTAIAMNSNISGISAEIIQTIGETLEKVKGLINKNTDNRWISVKDKLPDDFDVKIITIKDDSGDNVYKYTDFGWYFVEAKCWMVNNEPRTDITAWMELPEYYEEE